MRVFKWVAIGLGLIVLLVLLYLGFGSYSDGTRGGTLVKLSRKGLIFKTLEGQLNTGGISVDGTNPTSPLWDFSVVSDDPELIKTLEEANLNGHRVKLYYKEKFYTLPWRGDTKYFVYKAEKAP